MFSIGQAIMQATWPLVLLVPLQFGLGVQLYYHFASRFFIGSLHHHGFCCCYQEVQRFEQNAAQSHGTDIPNLITEFNCSVYTELIMLITSSAHWMGMAPSWHGNDCCCDSRSLFKVINPNSICNLSWCGYCWKSADSLPQGRKFWNVNYDLSEAIRL